jgi:hypothetical protein
MEKDIRPYLLMAITLVATLVLALSAEAEAFKAKGAH